VFRFAPLQGETAQRFLPREYLGDLSTVVVWDDGLLKLKSDASVHVFKRIGGVWPALGLLLRICPRFVRDFVYDVIATNRYKWFGRYDSCRLPTTEERRLLLP
jgi:predicted DCC family thiol-disulfide oxidoreductase YuxK